jgi:hypothetical protein
VWHRVIVALAVYLLNRDLAGLAALYSAIAFRAWPGRRRQLLGFLLGWLGAWLSVTRHLWQIEPR